MKPIGIAYQSPFFILCGRPVSDWASKLQVGDIPNSVSGASLGVKFFINDMGRRVFL
jgi:hypothetical protein